MISSMSNSFCKIINIPRRILSLNYVICDRIRWINTTTNYYDSSSDRFYNCNATIHRNNTTNRINNATSYPATYKRYLSASSSSSSGGGSSGSSSIRKGGTVWQRQAAAVKNTDFENSTYLDAIRAEHDPSLHIKTIEDELKGTIGKALGRQGEKILYYVRLMEQEYKKYVELQILSQEKMKQQNQNQSQKHQHQSGYYYNREYHHTTRSDNNHNTNDVEEQLLNSMNQCIHQYNEHRKKAVQARWELMVHRQAAGFIVDNHNIVMQHYPISDALPILQSLPLNNDGGDTTTNNNLSNQPPPETKKKSRDQLDWWQRIGRWK